MQEYLEETRGASIDIAGFSQTLVNLEMEGLEDYPTTFSLGPVEFSDDSRNLFIGYSRSEHICIGGYIKFGLEINW